MHSSIALFSLAGLSCLSTIVSAAPFSFPLSNGFPKITNPSPQLTAIEVDAHGSLPNGKPPPSISQNSLTSLQLIAFNELSEVAFFSELIANITAGYDGYNVGHDGARDFILNALKAVLAQEELHALNANGALAHFGLDPIQPCKYNFPVTKFEDAISLASTFTDVVLGTLQDVESLFGADGDVALIRGVASVIGQEGEQNGYYRSLLGKIPSALPFLTTSTREFAFSALNQLFIVPGSCPNSNTIKLPIFQPLTVESTNIKAESQTLKFSFPIATTSADGSHGNKPTTNYDNLSLVYINQQNTPLVEKLENIHVEGNTVHFEAKFPFDSATFGNGLTIAAVTNWAGPFASADDVAKATAYGPGLIEIN